MKTGDDTFDDIYVSKVTGEPVYVDIKGILYKLTKVEDEK